MDDLETRPAVDDLDKRQLLAELQAKMFGRRAAVELGPYVLTERLGSGAMGVVYVAEDPRLRRKVALKVLHPERHHADAEAGHRRLRKEARALSQVTHPNVIEVYDVGLSEDRVYIAMELVRGAALADWLEEQERPWRSILEVLIEAGQGLQAAHEAGVVHRDFKPSNVLVGDDGRVRVLDFGLAKEIGGRGAKERSEPALPDASDATVDGAVIGTPHYMAPAQLLGSPADVSSDQYAFCVTLFEALFGEPPFSPDSMLRTKQTGERATPRMAMAPPLRIQRAITRGLSPDPSHRFGSMAALLAAIDPRPRHQRLIAAGATVGAAALLVGYFFFSGRDAASSVVNDGSSKVRAMRHPPLLAQARFRRGKALANANRVDAAMDVLQAAHADAVASRHPRLQAEVAIEMARIELQDHQNLEEGERWIRDARSLLETEGGMPDLELNLGQLAVVAARARGDGPGAVVAARAVVDRVRAGEGDDGRRITLALQTLAVVLFEQQRFSEARTTLSEAIRVGERDLGPDHVLVAQCLSVLAAVDATDAAASDRDPAMLERAVRSARRAAGSFEGSLGSDHYETINAHMNLGIVLSEADQPNEARTELEFAMREFERVRGPSDPGIGVAAENLGLVQLQLGELEAAQNSLQRAVISVESVRGNDYPALAITLTHLGDVQLRRGFVDQARITYQRALDISQSAGPGPRAAALGGLGAVAKAAGNRARAAELFEASADAWAEALGPDSPQVRAAHDSAAAAR